MALLAKSGSFIKKSDTTGNQSITGLGFQPTVVFFFGNDRQSDGAHANAQAFFGIADFSVSEPGNDAFLSFKDNVSTSVGSAGLAVVRMELGTDADGTLISEGTWVSCDADGFTINWNRQDNEPRVICYLALGGDDITNTNTFSTNVGTSTGNQSPSGLGFQPNFLMMFNTSSQNTDNSIGIKDVWGGFGAADEALNQAYMAFFAQHNTAAASAIAHRNIKTDRIFGQITGSQRIEGQLTSFNADGYTINWGTHDGYAAIYQGLAMAGVKAKVGSFTQKTSTGEQTISGLGFKPKGIIFFSAQKTGTTITTAMQNMWGFADHLGNNSSVWWGASHQVNPTVADSYLDRTKAIKFMTQGTPTLVADAAVTEMGNGYFKLNWANADATARTIGYIAFGEAYEDTGYNHPTAHQNQFGTITNPNNTLNAYDDAYANFATAAWLELTTYGMNIPPNATITGIEVEVQAKVTGLSGFPSLNLYLNGNISNDKTTPTLTATDTTYVLGGPDDLWDGSWTPSDFLDSNNFHVALEAFTGGSTSVDVDGIRVKVYYTFDVVAKGNESQATGALANSLTWSHTVDPHDNRVLVISIAGWSSRTVTGVTFNGVAASQVDRQTNSFGFVEMWRLSNPDVGTHDIVVSFSGSNYSHAGAVDFYNANPDDPIGATNKTSSGSTGEITLNVTTLFDNSFVVDSAWRRAGPDLTVGASQDDFYESTTASTVTGAGSSEFKGSAGAVTMSWTGGVSDWMTILAEIRSFTDFVETTRSVTAKGRISKKPVETFIDNFNSGALDGKWASSAGVDINNNRLRLAVVNDEEYRYAESVERFDLTGSSFIVEIIDAPTLSDGTFKVALETPDADESNVVGHSWLIIGNTTLRAWSRQVGGTTSNHGWVSHDLVTNKFLRIRESGGTIYYETSPDCRTWTTFHSHSVTGFPITDLKVRISVYSADETGTYAILDNVNFVPSLQTVSAKANITCIGKPTLVTPANLAVDQQNPLELVWLIPESCNDQGIHAHVQVDDTDNTFGSLELDLYSYRDSNFEYWNGSSWQPYPTTGVSPDYSGNQARVTVNLSEGTKYWRVRGGRG